MNPIITPYESPRLQAWERVARTHVYHAPMILYACADLMFATRIAAAAGDLGLPNAPARSVEKLVQRLDELPPQTPATVIIDLDLADKALSLIDAARIHPAKPRVIAFGPHVEKDRLAEAKTRGADLALPRSAFTAKLPDLLQENP